MGRNSYIRGAGVVVVVAAALVMALGLAVLWAWHTGAASLIQIRPDLPPMPYASAVAFVLCGTALLGLLAGWRRVTFTAAGLAAALGLLSLARYTFKVEPGIDQLLVRQVAPQTALPSRIPPNGALCLLLAGGTLALLGRWPRRRGPSAAAAVSGSVVLGLGLIALAGYLIGLPIYGWWPLMTRMTAAGTVGFAALGAGLVAWAWREERAALTGWPRWLPLPVGLCALTVILCLWQAVEAYEGNHLAEVKRLTALIADEAGELAARDQLLRGHTWVLPEVTVAAGMALTLLLTLAVYLALVGYRRARLAEQAQAELRRSEEALRRAHAELEERVRERTAELESFTYSVSHDLRAPVRHIDGFSKLLLEQAGGQLSADGQRWLERIRTGTQQMGRMIDDLLSLSRMGRCEPFRKSTDLRALVAEAWSELRPAREGRDVDLRVGRLPPVECDPALLKQAFVNLLSNALKFTSPRPRAVIEIGHRSEPGRDVFFVRDNGVGFDMKYADKLFGVFQRLHRREEFDGTGVGLATVHRIIHKHGGAIWVEAEPDRGATFFFTLGEPRPQPRERAAAAAAGS